ncbi:MAG: type II toxin-antitoxin system VapC family toxin [Bacteroidota bacterium]
MQYLLDTNICIFFLRGQHNLYDTINKIGAENCFISEITVAELKFGAEKSTNPKNKIVTEEFISNFSIIPIFDSLDIYAKEKVRLQKAGIPVDDFDLLIGSTAVSKNLIMVTNNVKDFARIEGILIEDWTKNDGSIQRAFIKAE